jgi:hypothetical protein
MKDIYVVFSVMDTGSGSLTFPEDFNFVGYYEKEKDAQDHVERENLKNGIVDFGERVFDESKRYESSDDEDEEDEDEEVYDGPTDEDVFTYEKLSNLTKKSNIRKTKGK